MVDQMTIEPVFDNDCDLSLVACLESLDRQLSRTWHVVGQTPPPCDKLKAQRDHVRQVIIARAEQIQEVTPEKPRPVEIALLITWFGVIAALMWP